MNTAAADPPKTAKPDCDHQWASRKGPSTDFTIHQCTLCHNIDWAQLNRDILDYATAYFRSAVKPVTLTYAWSDGFGRSIVDQDGGVPDNARERALLRGLLTHAMRQLDEHDHPLRWVDPATGAVTREG